MLELSASRVWCSASCRSQKVVVIEVAKALKMMRRKFDTPEAEGTRQGGKLSSRIEIIATKKVPMPMPITRPGITNAAKLVSAVHWARMKYEIAKATKPSDAIQRASTLPISRPTNGDTSTDTRPAGAATSPAQVAV